jgi:hypothetical protein
MAIPPIQRLTMLDAQTYLGDLARVNNYQVYIENGWGVASNGSTPFIDHLNNQNLQPIYGVTFNTEFQRLLSFACAEATLPASTYATSEVKDNFMGVPQEFAHTRINTDIDFSFYVNRDYTTLTFFEAWMDYISGGNSNQLQEPSLYNTTSNYYRRYNYPKFYKNETGFYIKKFEKNYIVPGAPSLTYQLINAFPKSMSSIPLSYGEAEIMKVTVTMNYDRYRVFRETATDSSTDVIVGPGGVSEPTAGLNDASTSITSTSPLA